MGPNLPLTLVVLDAVADSGYSEPGSSETISVASREAPRFLLSKITTMAASRKKTDELEELHREATEHRKKPKGRRPAKSSKDDAVADTASDAQPTVWKEIEDAVSELQDAADEIESAATEHPVLALLTAFACGVVVGQLMSRKSS